MVYVGTFLNIIDNTGGNRCLCIGVYGNSKLSVPGKIVVIAVKSIFINRKITYSRRKKVRKGTVERCLLIRVSYQINRWGNYSIKFQTRGVALIGLWDLPRGTRIFGPIQYENKLAGKYVRVAMLSQGRTF